MLGRPASLHEKVRKQVAAEPGVAMTEMNHSIKQTTEAMDGVKRAFNGFWLFPPVLVWCGFDVIWVIPADMIFF